MTLAGEPCRLISRPTAYFHSSTLSTPGLPIDQSLLRRASKLSQEYKMLNTLLENDEEFTQDTATRRKKLSDLEQIHETFSQLERSSLVR